MIKKTHKFGIFLLAPAVILSGCAASSDKYPSLAIRDFERNAQTAVAADSTEPAQTAPYTVPSSTLAALNTARNKAQSQHAKFLAALPAARRKVAAARGSGPTSKGWAEAQVALADLASKRSQTAVYLSDVDVLIVDTAIAAKGSDYPRSVQSEVAAILASQDRSIGQLNAGL